VIIGENHWVRLLKLVELSDLTRFSIFTWGQQLDLQWDIKKFKSGCIATLGRATRMLHWIELRTHGEPRRPLPVPRCGQWHRGVEFTIRSSS